MLEGLWPSAELGFIDSFIRSRDAMLHARADGETFGQAIGEFAVANKPVFTYASPPAGADDAHLVSLGSKARTYLTSDDLTAKLLAFNRTAAAELNWRTAYDQFMPLAVMERFWHVFVRVDGERMSDKQLAREVQRIKAKSGRGGMTTEEYTHVMRYVRDHAPQRLLVWGLDFDSVLIDHLNAYGTTLFLEFDASWVPLADSSVKGLNHFVYDAAAFATSVKEMEAFWHEPHRADSIPQLAQRPCFDNSS